LTNACSHSVTRRVGLRHHALGARQGHPSGAMAVPGGVRGCTQSREAVICHAGAGSLDNVIWLRALASELPGTRRIILVTT
jgi:hypothetical protein